MKINPLDFKVQPVTKENWNQFVELFGHRGACANCWCMYYRLSKSDFNSGKLNNGNKDLMREIVWNGKPAGLLGFLKEKPVAWCAFAPREDFIKLEKSRVHKRIDDKMVWSIPCFFIHKEYRNYGISAFSFRVLLNMQKEKTLKSLKSIQQFLLRKDFRIHLPG